MDSSITATVMCPYCNFVNYVYHDFAKDGKYPSRHIVSCDCEEGGCDRYFAVIVHIRTAFNVFEMSEV